MVTVIKLYAKALNHTVDEQLAKKVTAMIAGMDRKTIKKNRQFICAVLDYVQRKNMATPVQDEALGKLNGN